MPELKRSLTLVQLVFYGVGTIVGAGIYSVIGAAAGEAGTLLWVSFLLSGLVAFLTVLYYAELSSMFPRAGAEYQFLRNAFPRLRILALLAGCLIALNASSTAATVSLAFAGYLGTFIDLPDVVVALALLSLCTLVNIGGIQQATWVSITLICVEVAGLLLLIAAGIAAGDWSNNFSYHLPSGASFPGSIFTAAALIFFVFIGFEDVANLSEEAVDPRHDIPRALILSVLITSTIYIFVALAAISLMSPADMVGSASPLAEAASTVAPWMGPVLAVAALFATASTALITLVSISRLLFGMAREGELPKVLAFTLPGRQTPWVAALALFGGACLLLSLGEIKILASISSFGLLLVFVGIHAAVIRLRFTRPAEERRFRVPLSWGRLPLPPVAGILAAMLLLTRFEPIVYAVGVVVIAAALMAGFVFHKKKAS